MPAEERQRPTSQWRRFVALTRTERWLLLCAWWTLLRSDVALRLAPRRTLAASLDLVEARPGRDAGPRPDEWDRAVRRAAAHHLWAMPCLPRSIALCRLLRRAGFAARLRIGIRDAPSPLPAHAWVELEGSALGEPEELATRFLALLPPAPPAPPG